MNKLYEVHSFAVDDEIPSEIDGFKIEYVHMNAWRGYYGVTPPKGWVEAEDDIPDWVTGDYSDAGENKASNVERCVDEWAAKTKGEKKVFVLPTSNLFSHVVFAFVKTAV